MVKMKSNSKKRNNNRKKITSTKRNRTMMTFFPLSALLKWTPSSGETMLLLLLRTKVSAVLATPSQL